MDVKQYWDKRFKFFFQVAEFFAVDACVQDSTGRVRG